MLQVDDLSKQAAAITILKRRKYFDKENNFAIVESFKDSDDYRIHLAIAGAIRFHQADRLRAIALGQEMMQRLEPGSVYWKFALAIVEHVKHIDQSNVQSVHQFFLSELRPATRMSLCRMIVKTIRLLPDQ